jgi:PAS domain S-box-containing protein
MGATNLSDPLLSLPNWTANRNGLRIFRISVLSLAFVVCVGAIMTLGFNVYEKIRSVQNARSDNVEWTLSQLEVEFIHFQMDLMKAEQAPSDPLASLRTKFDVFYSRLDTINHGSVYSPLKKDPAFAATLAVANTYLQSATAIMDSPDDVLRTKLPSLLAASEAALIPIRTISLEGLDEFARQSDSYRDAIASTLFNLAVLTTSLVLALSFVSLMLRREFRLSERRGNEVRSTAARMQTIISTSLDAIVVADKSGRITAFNAAAETMFGYTEDEALGALVADIMIPETSLEAHLAALHRYSETGRRHRVNAGRFETEARRKSGESFPVELSIASADGSDGEIFISFIRDITESKRTNAELVAARDKALAGEKAKAEFLAVMSHEIRTPLNGLLSSLSLVRDTRLTDKQAEHFDIMDISGRLLLEHVNNVLDVTKAEAGKHVAVSVPFVVDDLLSEVVASQTGLAHAYGNTLSYRWLTESTGWIAGDPVRLRQVLLNLVGNAMKFTRNGVVTIEAEKKLRVDGQMTLEIHVVDTGIGIAPEHIDRIFGDFETVDSSYARQTGGTGLGLGIARRLTQAMGGEISAESEEGAGSIFHIRIPITPCAPPLPKPRTWNDDKATISRNILVVEDNRINRYVLCEMLRAAHHQVTEAVNGSDGVRMAEETQFDLILMDISMPVMDGIEATKVIRAGSGLSRTTPIIAVTAHASREEHAVFQQAGINAFLSKPIDRTALLAAVVQAPELEPEEASAPDGGADALLDTQRLDDMRRIFGAEAFDQLLDTFLAETGDVFLTLVDAPQSGVDFATLKAALHKVAGSSGTLGIHRLHGLLVNSDGLAKAQREAEFRAGLPDLSRCWQATVAEIAIFREMANRSDAV